MKRLISLSIIFTLLLTSAVFAQTDKPYEYILPMEFERIERTEDRLIAYESYDSCALYNLSGEKLSKNYEQITGFNDGLSISTAYKNGIMYVLDYDGNELGKFEQRVFEIGKYILANISEVNNDGRPLRYYEGEFGVYDYNGNLIKALPYDKFYPKNITPYWLSFANDRLIFVENGKYGATDENFNTIIAPEYSYFYPFYNDITIAVKNSKYGLIDKYGNTVCDFIYDEITPLKWADISTYKLRLGEQYAVLSSDGKTLLKEFDEYEPVKVYEDYELITVQKPNTREDKDEYSLLFGVMDFEGNMVVGVENTAVYEISDEMIGVQKSYDHCGFYDIRGNEVTDFNYRMISPFSEGYAFASGVRENGEWYNYVIDKNGDAPFETENYSSGFFGGIAFIGHGQFVDTNGNYIYGESDWTSVSSAWYNPSYDRMFTVSDGEKCGYVKMSDNALEIQAQNNIPSDWAYDEIDTAIKAGLVPEDLMRCYRYNISREEFCEIVYNLPALENKINGLENTDITFDDTSNEKILTLARLGIIKGVGENRFSPYSHITREEAAVILHRTANIIGPFYATEMYFAFDDVGEISDWAENSVQVMCNMGIMKGVGNNKFAPKDSYTIEQAILTILRLNK